MARHVMSHAVAAATTTTAMAWCLCLLLLIACVPHALRSLTSVPAASSATTPPPLSTPVAVADTLGTVFSIASADITEKVGVLQLRSVPHRTCQRHITCGPAAWRRDCLPWPRRERPVSDGDFYSGSLRARAACSKRAIRCLQQGLIRRASSLLSSCVLPRMLPNAVCKI